MVIPTIKGLKDFEINLFLSLLNDANIAQLVAMAQEINNKIKQVKK